MIDVELEPPAAETWLRSFTDLRLALATRLEVEEGDEEHWQSLPDDDPRAQAHDIYEWVGYLQETLVGRCRSSAQAAFLRAPAEPWSATPAAPAMSFECVLNCRAECASKAGRHTYCAL